MDMTKCFEGKVVLITGASSGIGAAAAVRFCSFGAKVALCGRNIDNLRAVQEQCITVHGSQSPNNTVVLVGDVTKEDDVKNLVQQTINTFGQLDVLVNNAGVGGDSSVCDCDMSRYDVLFDTHCRATVMMTKYAVPHLKLTKGNIINISSISAVLPMTGELFYAMSKAALDSFTKCAAVELGAFGIRVNSVNPGVTKTNFHYRTGFTEDRFSRYLAYEDAATPLGRCASVDDVASAICYLSSSDAAIITGVCLLVDGGRYSYIVKYSGE